MDSWYFNKIAGAVLSALLVAFGAGTLADILGSSRHGGGHDEHAPKAGFVLPVRDAPAGGVAAAAPAFKFSDVAPLLKSASAESGLGAFTPCKACHTAEKDGKPGQGPNLWGVLGREIASNAQFPRYSAAFKAQKGPWTLERLAAYLHDPRAAIPGNSMTFIGVKSNADLADLLVYLRSMSDSPVPLPN